MYGEMDPSKMKFAGFKMMVVYCFFTILVLKVAEDFIVQLEFIPYPPFSEDDIELWTQYGNTHVEQLVALTYALDEQSMKTQSNLKLTHNPAGASAFSQEDIGVSGEHFSSDCNGRRTNVTTLPRRS